MNPKKPLRVCVHLRSRGVRVIDNNPIDICRRGESHPSRVEQNNANRIDKINNIISYFQNYLINLHNIFKHNKTKSKTKTQTVHKTVQEECMCIILYYEGKKL